jgi:stearoyl-CoA desaturase (delta-9 desaturase)
MENVTVSSYDSSSSRTRPDSPSLLRRIETLPFWAIHLASLGVLFFPFEWKWVALCAGLYFLRMFGITAGYHRYFSHRTYRLNRLWQFVMGFLGAMSLQQGPLWWAAHHRHHHRFSDMSEDLHSPQQRGFWYSHMFWFLNGENDHTRMELIPDLAKYPELRWLNQFHLVPGVLLALACLALGGWPAFFWGFALSTTLLWHGTFTINSLSHVFGSRRYQTTDTSRNNFWLALITMGEGWHNNHHCYQNSTNQGFFWWEIDVTYYVLRTLSWVGITSHLKRAPVEKLESRRISVSADYRPRHDRTEESPRFHESACAGTPS